jgi:hypothetical protein
MPDTSRQATVSYMEGRAAATHAVSCVSVSEEEVLLFMLHASTLSSLYYILSLHATCIALYRWLHSFISYLILHCNLDNK